MSGERVTEADVEEIIEVDSSIDVSVFIISAHIIVEKLLSSSGYEEDQLTEIERWFSAHLVAIRQGQIINEKIGEAQVAYGGNYGQGLDFTKYGQQVKILDTSGYFEKLGKRKVFFEAL